MYCITNNIKVNEHHDKVHGVLTDKSEVKRIHSEMMGWDKTNKLLY